MSYTAEIIAVGTELLMGSTANTNAQEISQALGAIGINVHYHTTVFTQRFKENICKSLETRRIAFSISS